MKARIHWWLGNLWCWIAARAATVASFADRRVQVHMAVVRKELGVPPVGSTWHEG